ncbi:hypothetical protein ACFRAO_30015 [Streptomyces sp. NPDC056656]|uniref:hypothetical protein n=1 Tax=Streptomyces sp. NPDC056656 TaxID=3345895 RepID=UPI00367643FE
MRNRSVSGSLAGTDVLVAGDGTTALLQLREAERAGFTALMLGPQRTRLRSAVFEEHSGTWQVETVLGDSYQGRYLVAAPASDSLAQVDVRGRDGVRLSDHWACGPRSYLGIMTAGFPNFFFPGEPHTAAGRPADEQVNLVTDTLSHAREHGHAVVEVAPDAEAAWTGLTDYGQTLRRLLHAGAEALAEVLEPAEETPAPPGLPGLLGLVAATAEDPWAAFDFSPVSARER